MNDVRTILTYKPNVCMVLFIIEDTKDLHTKISIVTTSHKSSAIATSHKPSAMGNTASTNTVNINRPALKGGAPSSKRKKYVKGGNKHVEVTIDWNDEGQRKYVITVHINGSDLCSITAIDNSL